MKRRPLQRCYRGRLAIPARVKQKLRKGRLAQLVEHLVYTERVSGSSPLPPTIFPELFLAAPRTVGRYEAGDAECERGKS